MADQVEHAPQAEQVVDFIRAHGTPFAGGANRPIRLNDPDSVWFISRGSVDVFAAHESDGGVLVEFNHLLRATSGRLLFQANTGTSVLVAKGLPDSQLLCVPRDVLVAAESGSLVADQVAAWVADISASIAQEVTHQPPIDRFVRAGDTTDLSAGEVVSTKRDVVWLSSADADLAFLSTEYGDPSGPGLIPVAPGAWVSASGSTQTQGVSSHQLHQQGLLLGALAEFHKLSLDADDLNRRLLMVDVLNVRAAQARHRQESEEAARQSLQAVVNTSRAQSGSRGTELLAALALIGHHEGIRFREPPKPPGTPSDNIETSQDLDRVLTASGVRRRDVALGAGDRWWRGDSGAMLAFQRSDGEPVALIPGRFGRYRMVDPASGLATRVNAARAAELQPIGMFFYQSLPQDGISNAKDLTRVAFRRWKGDMSRLVTAGMLAGLATLAPAIVLGVLATEVAPSGRYATLWWLTVAMLLLALTVGLLQVVQGTALMRLEGRAAARVTAALWDRLLNLPSGFFRDYTAGDLATRAMAFQDLRDRLSGVVMSALLSTIFLLPTFVLLFLYDSAMGWLGLVGGLLALTVTMMLGWRQVRHQRRLLAAARSLAGAMLQLVSAVRKLRVTGKEWTALTRWARDYRVQKHSEMKVGALNEHLVAFTTAAPLLAAAALFAVASAQGSDSVSAGAFIAVFAAYLLLMTSIAALGSSMTAVAAIVPAGEQVAPILKAAPQSAVVDAPTPELRGEVRLDNVSFRYTEESPLVLRGVSMHVQPGEFVALVGGTGAGKSTVLRVLLGLEKVSSGEVYYDRHNLDRINRRAVRQQVGVVMQNGSLEPRTICDNIIGIASDLTLDDAWRAARLAVVDRDIAAMPMGMHTVVTESLAVFSGGQIQRIMLASALVRNPRVLLLDEATSFLDNNIQAEVMERIEQLAVTRIAVAHRLSTIRKADRIYVLEAGRVVQQGTFDELMEEPGAFRELALRQIA